MSSWRPDGSGNGTHIATSEKILDKINQQGGKPFISFEYFPPRTDEGVQNLYARVERMATLSPLFMDFTWGAGGSTSDLTLELCTKTKAITGLDINMHMTCTNQVTEKVDQGLRGAVLGGVRNICALRGDPPLGQEKWEATEGGFNCALDLVKHIRKEYGDHFGISVAGYPEGHPDIIKPISELGRELTASEKSRSTVDKDGVECVCSDEDYKKELAYLKEKIDAGGEVILTQLFYDADVFIQFVKDCRAIGINAPILPGIMILMTYGGFKRMTGFCKTRVPADLAKKVEEMKDEEQKEQLKEFGIQLGADICKKVLASGAAQGLHFYTLNLENSVYGILEKLGLKATDVSAGAENENTFQGTLINTVIAK
ncbi:Methylenetetrahydrofolate reductase 1 [Cymbomonas tetramitiformis]|uniref:Methylenetetrahydrofolate reductase 1 n=1 Tax=Cymbomonas tetramitiformis TaxID=36881 RepID=A0AAE0L0B9_9CHLO|nr:Methylenetetrahydrofolate reductase 1 [Cymbomonas tetramitiformis]